MKRAIVVRIVEMTRGTVRFEVSAETSEPHESIPGATIEGGDELAHGEVTSRPYTIWEGGSRILRVTLPAGAPFDDSDALTRAVESATDLAAAFWGQR